MRPAIRRLRPGSARSVRGSRPSVAPARIAALVARGARALVPSLIGVGLVAGCGERGEPTGEPSVRSDAASPAGIGERWTLPPIPAGLAPNLAAELERRRARVEAAPESAEHAGELGIFYEANEMREEALSLLARARALDPGDPHWACHEAWLLARDGELEAALEVADQALERHAGFAPLHEVAGTAARRLGRIERAEQAFEALCRAAPKRAEGWFGLAETRLDAGRAADALEHADRALALDPSYRRIHYVRGLALRDLGRLDEAQHALQMGAKARVRRMRDRWSEALMTWSHSRTTRLTVAMQMQAQGRLDEALAHLEETLALGPDDARTWTQIGLVHRDRGQAELAIEAARTAVSLEPDAYQTRVNLGQLLLEAGKIDEALAEAEAASIAGPGVAKAHMLRSDALFAAGRDGEAIAALGAALERAPTHADMHAHAAQRLLSKGLPELALERLDDVLRAHAADARLTELRAAALSELGRDDEADAARARARALRLGGAGASDG